MHRRQRLHRQARLNLHAAGRRRQPARHHRSVIFDLAAEADIPISEPDLTRYDVFTADECFLTGTAAEVVPVVRCDTRVIGDGKPGPVTQRLLKMFRELVRSTGTPIDKSAPSVHSGATAEPAVAGSR